MLRALTAILDRDVHPDLRVGLPVLSAKAGRIQAPDIGLLHRWRDVYMYTMYMLKSCHSTILDPSHPAVRV